MYCLSLHAWLVILSLSLSLSLCPLAFVYKVLMRQTSFLSYQQLACS